MNWIASWFGALFSKRVSFADGSYVEWVHVEAIKYVDPSGRSMGVHWVFSHNLRKGRRLRTETLVAWDPPRREEPVTPEQRADIVSKIREYCEKRGVPLEIV
jgi:hypothetical protein